MTGRVQWQYEQPGASHSAPKKTNFIQRPSNTFIQRYLMVQRRGQKFGIATNHTVKYRPDVHSWQKRHNSNVVHCWDESNLRTSRAFDLESKLLPYSLDKAKRWEMSVNLRDDRPEDEDQSAAEGKETRRQQFHAKLALKQKHLRRKMKQQENKEKKRLAKEALEQQRRQEQQQSNTAAPAPAEPKQVMVHHTFGWHRKSGVKYNRRYWQGAYMSEPRTRWQLSRSLQDNEELVCTEIWRKPSKKLLVNCILSQDQFKITPELRRETKDLWQIRDSLRLQDRKRKHEAWHTRYCLARLDQNLYY